MTLTVTNDSDQTDSIQQDVTVDTAPTAAFTAPASAQVRRRRLSFDASASTHAPEASISELQLGTSATAPAAPA